MKFSTFATYLQKLEETAKRLEITDILEELISRLNEQEIDKAIYLALGYLQPQFDSLKFNIAEKMMVRALDQAYQGDTQKIYQKTGDLGSVAYELSRTHKGSDPSILQVHEILTQIAQSSGTGSQETKVSKTVELLKKSDSLSAKYIVRIILGTVRLGFTELTVIDALAQFLGDKKGLNKKIEAVYSTHPDLGLISKTLKTKGIKGLEKISIETGVPVLSQKAQRVENMQEAVEKMKHMWAEFKFDGTRVQLHLDKSKEIKSNKSKQTQIFDSSEEEKYLVRTFTRNLEETTHMYPEIIEASKKQINATSVILDGEAIGYNKETGAFLPFQETIQRKRKHNVSGMRAQIPLKYYAFDLLYLNGQTLVDLPLEERKKKLRQIVKEGSVITVDDEVIINNFDELSDYYEIAKQKKLEGLLLKNPKDPYQAGARSYSWVKIKKADEKLLDDSVEIVILGYYYGKGARSKFGIGGFLAGVYDEKSDSFKTVTKVGTGLTDEEWVKIREMCDGVKTNKKPANVEISKILEPDVYTLPKIVVEIGADEVTISPAHTAKYALRFPRLLKFRPDKPAIETTSVKEIEKMYKAQKQSHSK